MGANVPTTVGTLVRTTGAGEGLRVIGAALVGLVVGLGVPKIDISTVPEHAAGEAHPSITVNC